MSEVIFSFPLVLCLEDSPLSSSQRRPACSGTGVAGASPTSAPNVLKGTVDSVQSQAAPALQSFPHPTPPLHQSHPHTHSYSQEQPAPLLPPQPPIQCQNQTSCQPISSVPQQQTVPPGQPHLQPPKSSSFGSLSPQVSSPHRSCSWARGARRPPSVLLPRTLYNIITASDSSGLPRCTSFLPHMSVAWASSFR